MLATLRGEPEVELTRDVANGHQLAIDGCETKCFERQLQWHSLSLPSLDHTAGSVAVNKAKIRSDSIPMASVRHSQWLPAACKLWGEVAQVF